MTGSELYALHAEEFDSRGCIIDTWDELDELDRSVWDALALKLSDRFTESIGG